MKAVQNLVLRLLIVLALVIVPMVSTTSAQGLVSCDATLITLLVIATQQYGYISPTDLSLFDFGQYGTFMQAQAAIDAAGQAMTDAGANVDSAADQVSDAQADAEQASEDIEDAADELEALGLTDAANAVEGAAGAVQDAAAGAVEAVESAGAAVDQAAAATTTLSSGVVAGENAACTALRIELEAFFLARFTAGS